MPERNEKGLWASSVSNFSIQYNYTAMSMAMVVMVSHWDSTTFGHPDFPEPSWAKRYLLGSVFFGSVVGMLTMGYVGDLIGVRRALALTNSMVGCGALASALLSWGQSEAVWSIICVSRLVLGAGVGGNYPLSAEGAAESGDGSVGSIADKAGKAFFWQGPGACSVYLVGLLLLQLPPTDVVTSIQFRVLLGLGALPSLLLVAVSLASPTNGFRHGNNSAGIRVASALRDPRQLRRLFGTAGTWFLFDVAWYGTAIFAPTILENVFGRSLGLSSLAWRAFLLALFSTFSAAAGVHVLPKIGARWLATLGMLGAALTFFAFAWVHKYHPEQHHVLFGLLCLVTTTLSFGPNVATFVLPVISFSGGVRSTFHGISAGAAKFGALLGALFFPVVDEHYGIPAVMFGQACVSLAAAFLSYYFCEDSPIEEHDEGEAGMESSHDDYGELGGPAHAEVHEEKPSAASCDRMKAVEDREQRPDSAPADGVEEQES